MNAQERAAPRELRKPKVIAINLEEPWQIRWWCDHFSVSRTELFVAIRKVGVDATMVRQALGK